MFGESARIVTASLVGLVLGIGGTKTFESMTALDPRKDLSPTPRETQTVQALELSVKALDIATDVALDWSQFCGPSAASTNTVPNSERQRMDEILTKVGKLQELTNDLDFAVGALQLKFTLDECAVLVGR